MPMPVPQMRTPRSSKIRIVDRVDSVGADVDHPVTAADEPRLHLVFQVNPGVIGAHGNHGHNLITIPLGVLRRQDTYISG
jgi:hypothetical protein